MSEKEILYQILGREIGNILRQINPMLGMFSDSATKYIINLIDPYINAFFLGGDQLNTEMAGAFIKQEVNSKVDEFILNYEKMKQNGVRL